MTCALNPRTESWPRLLALSCLLVVAPAQAMTLSEALKLAEQRDPAVAGSLAQLDADRELGRQARATLLPQASVVGRYQETDSKVALTPFGGAGFNERYPNWEYLAELRQPVFRFDFLARLRRADALDEQAEAAGAQREQALIYRVADRYLGVLRARSALALSEREAASIRRSLEDTRKRFEVQLVPGTDLREAQARDDLAQAALLVARQRLETAQDLLEESTGNGYVALPDLAPDAPLPGLDEDSRDIWLQRTLAGNPALRLARANLDIARANSRSSQSQALPELDAVASYGEQDQSEARFASKGSTTVVGLELRVPLLAGGGNLSRIREASARLRQAQGEMDRLVGEVQRETRRLLREAQTTRLQVGAFRQALASATVAEQATRYGYEAGKRTMVDVLNAQAATAAAQRNLDDARYNHLLSLLALKQYAGALGLSDFELLDELLTPMAGNGEAV